MKTAALLIALLLGVAPAGGAEQPYPIYTLLPQSGSNAFVGKGIATTLSILERSVNASGGVRGRPIHFVILDDQSTPQVAVQLTDDLIAKKVPFILGSTLVSTCNAMAAITKDGPVVYCFSPAIHPPPGSYMFSFGPASTDSLAAAARYVHERSWNRVALITTTDATGQDTDQHFDAAVGAQRGEATVAREHFNITDVSVAAQIARIKASGADVLFAWVAGTPFGTILRAVRDGDLEIPIITIAGNMTYAQMDAYKDSLPQELYFGGIPALGPEEITNRGVRSAVAGFLAAFKAAGVRPDVGEALGWDPATILIGALRRYGFDVTAEQVRDYIANIHAFNGIYGTFDFRRIPQRGVGVDNVIIERWDATSGNWIGASKPGGFVSATSHE